MLFETRQVWEMKNGMVAKIIDVYDYKIKLRCIRPCSGKRSEKDKRGHPYTYQQWTTENALSKRIERQIGSEELLEAVFNHLNLSNR